MTDYLLLIYADEATLPSMSQTEQEELFAGYAATERVCEFVDELDIVEATTVPPQDTRAKGRSDLVRKIIDRPGPRFYLFDWSGVAIDRNEYIEMPDPFKTYSS